jgi:hypothetical protein
MVDILFLAHNRPEFTRASLNALLENTPAAHVFVMTDGDMRTQYIVPPLRGVDCERYGGPVACMNAFLKSSSEKPEGKKRPPEATSEFIAKIDSDTIVPPGWLPDCLDLMHRYPSVDLLGIEPWTPDQKLFPTWKEPGCIGGMNCPIPGPMPIVTVHALDWFHPRPVSHIGGIGVFRRSAFERFGRPVPNSKDGRYGMTEWQWNNPSMVKAFIDPPLPVFLLDHLPFEPWRSLSRRYETEGIQRNVGWEYDTLKHRALWDWAFASGGMLSAEGQGVGGPEE